MATTSTTAVSTHDASNELLETELEAIKAIYDDAVSIETDDRSFSVAYSHKDTTLQIVLEEGYPVHKSALPVVFGKLSNFERDRVTKRLQTVSDGIVGREAVMELIQIFEASLEDLEEGPSNECTIKDSHNETTAKLSTAGRRWIWVHHITNRERVKTIVSEAKERQLGGYVKSGYPGIVVVEGNQCDEFVKFIKGSKSCPNGFGRNWGHHVRGHMDDIERKLPKTFVELTEMNQLASS